VTAPASLRWTALFLLLLALILVPFLLYEEPLTEWTRGFLEREPSRWWAGATLGALLAGDILLPVPSSLVSTAAGYLLGWAAATLVSWAGMTAGCALGYLLGGSAGRGLTRRFVGEDELARVSQAHERFRDWTVVLFRAVPVLAEASVVYAGVIAMPRGRFFLLAGLSNLGIAAVYGAVGAYALRVESFLLAFAGAVLLPAVAMAIARVRRL